MIAGALIGVICTCLIYIAVESIVKFINYNKMYEWLEEQNVDIDTLTDSQFRMYYAMWKISKIDGVEIAEIKTTKNDKAPL